mmetsp:Transcript_25839/g.103234  ORF Transcript_25839/g.103234 Transcript_25839/m.103234 type:complete len:238 (+) Transcript_25839:2065-2778(+)
MSGPMLAACGAPPPPSGCWSPWPSRRSVAMRARSLSRKASYTASCTRTRSAQTHVCPAKRNLDAMATSTATSRSASSRISSGAFPPSSSPSFFTVPAHCAYSALPTAVDPVNESARTAGDAHNACPTAAAFDRLAVTTLKHPAGARPSAASSHSFASASAVSGTSSAGLSTTGQPAASAAPHLRVIMASGKFHGVMAAATPAARRTVASRRSVGPASSSPAQRRGPSSANHSRKDAP